MIVVFAEGLFKMSYPVVAVVVNANDLSGGSASERGMEEGKRRWLKVRRESF